MEREKKEMNKKRRIIGFILNNTITGVDSLSNDFILFYADNEKDYLDIRSSNLQHGTFYDYDTGDLIKSLSEEENFIIVNSEGKLIFDSEGKMSNEELVRQYTIVANELGVNIDGLIQ